MSGWGCFFEKQDLSYIDARSCTARLRPFRARRKAQTVAIDERGRATLECRVGGAVARLRVSRCGRRCELSATRASDGATQVVEKVDVSKLSQRFWPLYRHLGRAVELVRSRTRTASQPHRYAEF